MADKIIYNYYLKRTEILYNYILSDTKCTALKDRQQSIWPILVRSQYIED